MRRCGTDRKRLAGHRDVGGRGLALHVERRPHPAHRPRVAGRGDLRTPRGGGGGGVAHHHGAAPPAATGAQPAPRGAGCDPLSPLLPVHGGGANVHRRPCAVHHLYGPDIRRRRLGAVAARAAVAHPTGRRRGRHCGDRHPRRLRPGRTRRLTARRPGGAGIGGHAGGLRPRGTVAAPRQPAGDLRDRRLRLGRPCGSARRRGHAGPRGPRGRVAVDRAARHRTAGNRAHPHQRRAAPAARHRARTSSRRRKCPRGSSSASGWCRKCPVRRRWSAASLRLRV